MNNRIAILPYGASDSVNALVEKMTELGKRPIKLRRQNSVFQGRDGDLIVNWGNSTVANPERIIGAGRVLNHPNAIKAASNKVNSFQKFLVEGVKSVDWTCEPQVAQLWLDAGGVVYARTKLQGHSGEGIVVCTTQDLNNIGDEIKVSRELVDAPLYTLGQMGQRDEMRVHVLDGKIVYLQQKKRARGYEENPNYSDVVRNYHTGWIYAVQGVRITRDQADVAIKAVESLGLNFGAVDLIIRDGEAIVLEVNTAPGLQGTNLQRYAERFLAIFNGEETEDARGLVIGERAAPVDEGVAELAAEIAVAQPEDLAVDMAADAPLAGAVFEAPGVNNAWVIQAPADEVWFGAGQALAHNIAQMQAEREAEVQEVVKVDKGFYVAKINQTNEITVVQLHLPQNRYYMVGWDVPLFDNALELIRKVEV